MRTIKYRGQRRSDRKWIYGLPGYTSGGEVGRINGWAEWGDDSGGSFFDHEVIPETVGEFTGLLDKNGKEIYEGDVISRKRHKEPSNWASEMIHGPNYFMSVVFSLGCFISDYDGRSLDYYIHGEDPVLTDHEVIGNIHENPELS